MPAALPGNFPQNLRIHFKICECMPHSYTHMLVLHTNFMHANKMKVNWFICGTRRLSGGERKGLGGTNQWPEGSASFTGDTLAAVPHSHTQKNANDYTEKNTCFKKGVLFLNLIYNFLIFCSIIFSISLFGSELIEKPRT